jgi:SmpA / OmlA family
MMVYQVAVLASVFSIGPSTFLNPAALLRESRLLVARAVKESNMSGLEKGAKLGKLISKGMTMEEVLELLGRPLLIDGFGRVNYNRTWFSYSHYHLYIQFGTDGKVSNVDRPDN